MVNNIFNSFSEQAKNFYEPAFKFNQLVLNNAEKIARAQVEAFTSYAELGIEQLHDAASIKEVGELKDFVNKQAELAGNLSKKMSDDANKLMTLSHSFKDDITKFTEETVKDFNVEPIKPAKASK